MIIHSNFFKNRKQNKYSDLEESFRVFDKDGNGYISKTEIDQIMASVGKRNNPFSLKCVVFFN